MTKRLMLVAVLMAGCGTDVDPDGLIDCPAASGVQRCEPLCAAISSGLATKLPLDTKCTGTNETGVVNNQGDLTTEFACDIFAVEVDGRIGCCLGSDDREEARFFECESL